MLHSTHAENALFIGRAVQLRTPTHEVTLNATLCRNSSVSAPNAVASRLALGASYTALKNSETK